MAKRTRKEKQQDIVKTVTAEARAVKDMQRLYDLEAKSEEAEAVMLERKQSYNDAKAAFEASQVAIREFIRACRDEKKDFPLLHVADSQQPADEGCDGWKDVPLDQVIQEKKVVSLLVAEGGTTLGAYCDWRAANAGDGGHYEPLLTFKGIGQAKADKVADQVIAWWAQAKVDHPRWGEDPKETKSDDQKTEP